MSQRQKRKQKPNQNSKDRSQQKEFEPLMLQDETCASQEHDIDIGIELNEASKKIVIACEVEGNIVGNVKDESTAIPQSSHQSQSRAAGRKSSRQRKQPRSYSPSLLADGQKASKRRKMAQVKRRETERLHDKLSDGSPFCCDLCGSGYVCKPSRKSRSGKVSRHMPYPRFGTDPNTGKSLMMCNACGLAFNRPNKKIRLEASVDLSEKEKYLKDAKEFGDSLAQQLNEPLAERLYCPKFVKKACGCIQTYIVGMNSDNINLASQRAQELLEILKAAKELASLKFYDTVTELGVPKPKNKRGTIGLGYGQRRSKIYEAFVLEERKKLKEGQKLDEGFCLCEVACQRLLCYSNNFLHKKLKTVEGVKRVTRTKGKLKMGLLKPIHELPTEWCCGDRCSRMAISHGKLLQRWRSLAKVGQSDARRVLAEMLTPAGGSRPNCYRFIAMVTGCSSSTICRVNEQMRETGGDREPPVHGLKEYWKNKPKKEKQGKKVKLLVDTQLNVPSYSVQNQLLQNQILHHAAVTKDGKKVITQRSLLKHMNNQVNVDELVDVPVTEILSETSVAGSILESFQAIPNQTSLAGPQNQSITIQLAPTYAQTMEHYQVLAENSNLGSIQFANTSGPLNLSSHTQSEVVAGDGFQNCVLENGPNVLGVPLGQAITSLVGDAFVTGEVLPRYSDVVSLKKRASEGAKNMSQSNDEREQERKIVPVSSLGLPIVSSSILPTDGNTVPVTEVLTALTDAQITGIENDCYTIRNADTDSETIPAKVDEKEASSCSVQLNQNVTQTTSEKVISSSRVEKKQPVSLLRSNQVQPQVLQYQCQQPYSVPYGNSVQYVSHQPGSFQLIHAPNGGYQILANTNMCVQPQGQVIQVISPPDGPTVLAENSKDGIQAGTKQMSKMTSVMPEVKVEYICMKETPINNEQCSALQENSLTVQSSASNVEYAQLPSPGTGSAQMPTEAAVGVSEDMETGRIQHLSTDEAVACNATSGMDIVDQELGGKGRHGRGESGNRSNSDESPAVIKDISKVNAPVLHGLLSKATASASLQLSSDQLAVVKSTSETNNVNFKTGEKDTKERRNDFSNDDSPAMANRSSKVNSSVVGQLSRPPVPSSVHVNNSSPGKELVLASLTTKDGAFASSQSVMTKKCAGEQERGLKSPAKSSDLKNNVLVAPNPNVVTSPMKPNFVQVPVSQPSGGGVQIMTVPVCSGLMKFAPVRCQYVNSNAGIVSAPPMNLAGNIPVIGNSNNLRFVMPDGKIQMYSQQAGTVVVPAPGTVQMTSLGSALPLSYTVQTTNSPLMSPGNKPIQMVPLRMATGGVPFLNPNFQPIPRSPPPKYRSPLTSSKGALIKKDFKNLVPNPSVGSCKGPIILQPMKLTVMPEPVGKAVTMVTSASSEKPTTN